MADLPVEERTIERLRLLGLRSLEECKRFSMEELRLQFGEEGQVIWEWCRGILPPEPPEEFEPESPEVVVELEEASLEGALEKIARPGILQLQLHFEPGPVLEVNFSRGFSKRVVLARMETLVFEEAPLRVRAVITQMAPVDEEQLSLFEDRRFSRPLELMRRRPRKGSALMRVVWDEPGSRLPERRAHLESLLDEGFESGLCLPQPLGETSFEVAEAWEVEEDWWTERPISRTYVRAFLPSGACARLFRDRISGRWFQQ